MMSADEVCPGACGIDQRERAALPISDDLAHIKHAQPQITAGPRCFRLGRGNRSSCQASVGRSVGRSTGLATWNAPSRKMPAHKTSHSQSHGLLASSCVSRCVAARSRAVGLDCGRVAAAVWRCTDHGARSCLSGGSDQARCLARGLVCQLGLARCRHSTLAALGSC